MDFLNNLNSIATICTFGCVSFALSGMGVKLGKYGSSPHKLGFKYISENGDKSKEEKLYDATAKMNKHFKLGPSWVQEKTTLTDWCKKYEKSTRKWGVDSQYCLLQNNVWHKLIENNIDVSETNLNQTKNVENASNTSTENRCTYEVLNRYADNENHVNFLIGRKLCSKNIASTTQGLNQSK